MRMNCCMVPDRPGYCAGLHANVGGSVRTVYGHVLITSVVGELVEPCTTVYMFFPESGFSKVVKSGNEMGSALREILKEHRFSMP